ncbi:hypothetical protein AN958_04435 [Leucoagaricus sp. SymC.cos]|nr:hypothetical protein AN958_04435 [Leucoagaricus sp. SymC.cos]
MGLRQPTMPRFHPSSNSSTRSSMFNIASNILVTRTSPSPDPTIIESASRDRTSDPSRGAGCCHTAEYSMEKTLIPRILVLRCPQTPSPIPFLLQHQRR